MNKLYKLSLICTLCFTLALQLTMPVAARSGMSDATITFVEDDEGGEGGGGSGGGGGGGGSSAGLVLASVPTFDFGIQDKLPKGTVRYHASEVCEDLSVNDRRATGAGWNVTASLSNFTTSEGRISLVGAYLTLQNGDVIPASGQYVNVPRLTGNPLRLDAGGHTKIAFRADRGQGYGLWSARWAEMHVGLTVIGETARAGSHSATLTWTLEDAPG